MESELSYVITVIKYSITSITYYLRGSFIILVRDDKEVWFVLRYEGKSKEQTEKD